MATLGTELEHPQEIAPSLYNEVFVQNINSRPVSMEELKKIIAKMVRLVSRKNQWFCVWSVLRHHNLLANYSHEAFARQMMSDDWFGGDTKRWSKLSWDGMSS